MQQDTAISSDTISSLFRLRTKDTENTDSFHYRQASFLLSFPHLDFSKREISERVIYSLRHLSWKTMNRGLIIHGWFKRFDNFKQSQPSILNVVFLSAEKIWTGSFPNVLTPPFIILERNCYLCEEFSSKVVRVGDRGDESARRF